MADSKTSKIFNKYLARMNVIKKDTFASHIYDALSNGKNSYMRIDRLESSSFDLKWVEEIEDCIYDLGDIIANPKQVTKIVTGIVPVELAKKTGAESVIHLASHTQYIKEITEDGDVIPNKILNMGSEEDIHTYENRFIATLVRRLLLFIEKRYEFVKKFAPLHDEEILFYKTKAIVDGAEVEIETKIKVKSESETVVANMSNAYIDRILKIREYITYYYGSRFMKELKTERDVRNPIVMTNIIRKNPKYNHCYRLFRFIEKYDQLGVSYSVDEHASIFSAEELDELNTVMFTNYLALKAKDKSKVTKSFSRTYKPRILTSIDDEQFIYGDLLKGPIEFLRVDQGYQEYLESLVKKDLPTKPTKLEKEYYKDELKAKKEAARKKAALEKLEKRKKKEQLEYEKKIKAILAQREKERQEEIARQEELARLEEERRIEEIRQALIKGAQEEHGVPVNNTPVEEEPINNEYVNYLDVPEDEESSEDSSLDMPNEGEVNNEENNQEEIINEPVENETENVEEPVEEAIEEENNEEQPSDIGEDNVEEVPSEIEEPSEVVESDDNQVSDEQEPSLDDIRNQLINDALNDTQEDNAQEVEVVEEANESDNVLIIPGTTEEENNEEQPSNEIVEDNEVIEELDSEDNDEYIQEIDEDSDEDEHDDGSSNSSRFKGVHGTGLKGPRYIKIGKKRVKKEKPEVKKVEKEEEHPSNFKGVHGTGLKGPRYIKIKKKKVEEENETSNELEDNNVPEVELEENNQNDVENTSFAEEINDNDIEMDENEVSEELEKIPGKFIVKTSEGYYVDDNSFTHNKGEARVFDDFNEANSIKKALGGKVVKL